MTVFHLGTIFISFGVLTIIIVFGGQSSSVTINLSMFSKVKISYVSVKR